MDFSIELYETPRGDAVVEGELNAIEAQAPILHALLLAGLSKLKHRDHHRPPLCLPIGDGLFELRVGHKDIARGLWFFQRGQRIVVVRCFIKKSQKTPPGELEIARRRMHDYLSRQRG